MRDDHRRANASAPVRALIALASLLSLPCFADEAPDAECSSFRGTRGLTVGGHETSTPVIPVAIEELTIDLHRHQACHTLHWSVYTVKGISREHVCFDIGAGAKDEKVAISATFPTGVTTPIVELSAGKDRAMAEDLAASCRMHSKRSPAGPGSGPRSPAGGLDI